VKWLIGLPPEAQATLAVGVIAILVQPIFIVITFLLGKSQGRAQTRHERASDALVEAMRMMSDVQIDLFMWSSHVVVNEKARSHGEGIPQKDCR
jgi:hypothetical protein